MINAITKPLTMPGVMMGIMTFTNALKGFAPRSRAASYMFGSMDSSLGSTLSTT